MQFGPTTYVILGILGLLGPTIAMVVIAAVVLIWMRRRPGRAVAGPPPLPGESELLRLYERLQSRAGRRRAPPETPLEYLRSFPSPLQGRGALEEVTHAVNEGAYAGRWPDPSQVRELSKRLS